MKKVAMFLLALFVIAGCNNNGVFENAIKEGKEAIANEEYDKALEFFESALEEKTNDEEARILVSQTEKMIKAINEQDDGNIAEAIVLFEEVENMEDGYDKLSEQATERKEALAEADNSATATSSNKVFIDYAIEELLGKYDSYYEFRADNSGESVIFWSEKSISNFNFIEIGFENEDSNFSYFQEEILYSIDKLSPEKPVVIKTIISEGIPNRGISYTDESGEVRYFYIAWSGYDDSLSLVEFENKVLDDSSSGDGSSDSGTSSNDSSSSDTAVNEGEFFEETKNYILYGQGGLSYAESLNWDKVFLEQVNMSEVYQEYLAAGGTSDNVKSFAEYLTLNAPINSNWEALIREALGVEVTRFEPVEGYEGVLYQAYIMYEGSEIPYVTVNARTGYWHG